MWVENKKANQLHFYTLENFYTQHILLPVLCRKKNAESSESFHFCVCMVAAHQKHDISDFKMPF